MVVDRDYKPHKNMTDITGKRFGKLVAIKPIKKNLRIYWECVCDCGNTVDVYGTNLRTGHTTSCGCGFRHCNSESKTHLYMHYGLMKARCSPKYHYRKSYYDKGIKVCDEWLHENGYLNFKEWALNNGYADGLTLDRIDNDGDYEPSNCRWATIKEQANNRSTNSVYEYEGMRKTLTEWGEYLGISRSTLKDRQRRGIKPPQLFDKTHLRSVSRI